MRLTPAEACEVFTDPLKFITFIKKENILAKGVSMKYHIKSCIQLTTDQISQIAHLHQICNENDQIQIKVNWDMLEGRTNQNPYDFLCFDKDELIGYLALYIFHEEEAEVSAFVHPNYRKREIFTRLIQKATTTLQKEQIPQFLFIVDHQSRSGQAIAHKWGCSYHHSEYKMIRPEDAPLHKKGKILLEHPKLEDIPQWLQLDQLCFSFSNDYKEYEDRFQDDNYVHFQYKIGKKVIGKLSVQQRKKDGYIYGFCIHPLFQKRGIGTAMLQETIDALSKTKHILLGGCHRKPACFISV